MAKKLAQHNFSEISQVCETWCVTTEYGETLEDVLKPEFWCNVAKQLKPWALVFVRDIAMEWCANLIVADVGAGWAKVRVISHTVFDTTAIAVPAGKAGDHIITFAGPVRKFQVVRISDKQMLKDGMSKAEANAWLGQYLNTIAA